MGHLGSQEDLKIQSNHKTVSALDVSDFKRDASVSIWIYVYMVGNTAPVSWVPIYQRTDLRGF